MSGETVTLEEWRADGRRRFGDDPHDWSFVCPRCGDVYTGREFHDTFHEAGLEGEWVNHFGRICLGRMLGALDKSIPKGKYTGRGCDWCAFGLFRGPVIVEMGNGETAGVFRFASAE